MDKRTLFILSVAVLLITGAVAFVLLQNQPNEDSKTTSESTSESTAKTTETTSKTQNRGQYVEYSSEAVASASDTKLLFFHASWCPQCRALDASIKSSELPENLTIFKVDYDTNQALRRQHGVTIQTTVVLINDNGEKIDSFVAYDDPSFSAIYNTLLQ